MTNVVKHTQIRKHRASNYQGTDAEWEALLKHALLQIEPDDDEHVQVTHGVETVATAGDDGKLTITIRKNISGITQRLGSIQLEQDGEQEIELFDWTGIAALSATDAQEQVTALNSKLQEQQEAVTKLNAQLDDLIKAKQEHEDELLQKFTELLNAKKLKIRNQQRLLSGARVDGNSGQAAPPSAGKGKRKARGRAASGEGEPESDDGFEPLPPDAMDVDIKNEDQDDDDIEQGAVEMTPDQTPEQTDSEDGDDLDIGAKPKSGQIPMSSSPPPEASNTLRSSHVDPEQTTQEIPPKRDLPFAKHNLRGSGPAAAADDDEGDETDDDEL